MVPRGDPFAETLKKTFAILEAMMECLQERRLVEQPRTERKGPLVVWPVRATAASGGGATPGDAERRGFT